MTIGINAKCVGAARFSAVAESRMRCGKSTGTGFAVAAGAIAVAAMLVFAAFSAAKAQEGLGGVRPANPDGVIRGEPIPDISQALETIESRPSPTGGADRGAGAAGVDGWSARNDDAASIAAEGKSAGSGSLDSPGGNSAAADLLRQAEDALGRKDIDGAQQILERIVANAPRSKEATVARQKLGAIYRGDTASLLGAAGEGAQAASHSMPSTAPDSGGVFGLPAAHGDKSTVSDGAGEFSKGELPGNVGGGQIEPAAAGQEAAISSAAPAANLSVAPGSSPWLPRARRTHRFEELMRADVGDRIFFGSSSSDVGGRARAVLERQAEWLMRYPDLYIVVEGHSDDPGDEITNDRVALRRAEVARSRLIASGVVPERIDIEVRGRRDRAVVCEEATCRSQNRRVVMRLMVVLPGASTLRDETQRMDADFGRFAHDAIRQQPSRNTPPDR